MITRMHNNTLTATLSYDSESEWDIFYIGGVQCLYAGEQKANLKPCYPRLFFPWPKSSVRKSG